MLICDKQVSCADEPKKFSQVEHADVNTRMWVPSLVAVKLWDGCTGNFIATLRGHIGPVYQVAWSSDSRLLLSGSKDSTLKVWEVRKHKLVYDLPGHSDEVYTVDWNPMDNRAASGGKDKVIRIWRH